jgi:hypothetical protein
MLSEVKRGSKVEQKYCEDATKDEPREAVSRLRVAHFDRVNFKAI